MDGKWARKAGEMGGETQEGTKEKIGMAGGVISGRRQPRSDRKYRQFKTQSFNSNPLVHFVNAKSITWSKLPSEVQIIEIDARPF